MLGNAVPTSSLPPPRDSLLGLGIGARLLTLGVGRARCAHYPALARACDGGARPPSAAAGTNGRGHTRETDVTSACNDLSYSAAQGGSPRTFVPCLVRRRYARTRPPAKSEARVDRSPRHTATAPSCAHRRSVRQPRESVFIGHGDEVPCRELTTTASSRASCLG